MRLFLLMLGNDARSARRAAAVIRSLADTRAKVARCAFGLLVIAAFIANAFGLAIIFGGRQ